MAMLAIASLSGSPNLSQSSLKIEHVTPKIDTEACTDEACTEAVKLIDQVADKIDTKAAEETDGFAGRIDKFETDLSATLKSIKSQLTDVSKTTIRDIRTVKNELAKIKSADYDSEIAELKRRLDQLESAKLAGGQTYSENRVTETIIPTPLIPFSTVVDPMPVIAAAPPLPVITPPRPIYRAAPTQAPVIYRDPPPRPSLLGTVINAGKSCYKCNKCGKVHCR